MAIRIWLGVVTMAVIGMAVNSVTQSTADEGMWLFSNAPRKLLKEKYGFEPTDKWLAHLQQSAVRFNSGGSGSFISSDGLVMTNHHVGADALQKLSSEEHDYLASGFLATSRDEEIKCVDLELNVLMNIKDVTDQISAAVKGIDDSGAAEKARRAAMNTIEKEASDKSGLRSDVVTLYHGGQYHLYQYKKYTDVRLVLAPEQSVAFFGGDPDNFEFPRYDLDVCFFRAYEQDRPAKIEHYLTWSKAGAQDGELVFVAGHPGHTDRLNTVAHLEFLRDEVFPDSLDLIRRREVLLRTFGERSAENDRRASDELFGYQNSRKARLGGLAGLQDPVVMKSKRAAEAELRKAMSANKDLKDSISSFDDIEQALATWGKIRVRLGLLENSQALNSELFGIAHMLVRMAAEDEQPNAERLREYRESNRESLEQNLFSEAPLYGDLETLKLADSLGMLLEQLPADDEVVQQILAGHAPRERAAELVRGTKLKDVAVRKELAAGGAKAIAASTDPMIQLARLVDPHARALRKTYEEQVQEPLRQAYAKLANARYVLYGADNYPDATFTLRLAIGVVKGYTEEGRFVPPITTIGGAFEHADAHDNEPPFDLPERWLDAKDRLNLKTPFNFVSTNDIIGGNSGSPVVNRNNEVVGIIFDGNIQSLVLDFAYTDQQARAVSVHSAGIIEALRKVYEARTLADEIERRPAAALAPAKKGGK